MSEAGSRRGSGRGVEVVNGGARAVWSALSGRFCGAGYPPAQAGGGGV
ncbi:hypothetical protein GS473_23335 [Rhodococcus hoagii]|nr:hypothetical protein [Prescottella equi]